MVWGDIGYTPRSPLVRIGGTLNGARYIPGVLRPVDVEFCETLHSNRIRHNRMLHVFYGPSLIRKIFGCCPSLRVHQIFHQ
ncbi:hypothetical protein TNCV_588721 [Trichonephila clavipes]|nr:hypothetical protein TNCV_588721 [Trichonephila clavipes]